MKTPAKSFVATGLLRLLLFDGFMMVVLAAPLGLAIALQEHHESRSDWHSAVFDGAVIGIALALIGGVFLGLGALIVKRRLKSLGYNQDEDMA
jgi:hypothetical protein